MPFKQSCSLVMPQQDGDRHLPWHLQAPALLTNAVRLLGTPQYVVPFASCLLTHDRPS